MKIRICAALLLCLGTIGIVKANDADSLFVNQTIEGLVVKSGKETSDIWKLPSSLSVIMPSRVEQRNIMSVKDLSSLIPNFFIPDYGSRMTTPVYLRGIGARSGSQGVGFYVDNVPLMDKSVFDFDMQDIQRIDVLRGPQGTLYGRNAMGGIINLYTLSPMDYQGTRIKVGGGNYDSHHVSASHYARLSRKVGLSVGGNFLHRGGYYKNVFTGRRIDDENSSGARVKLVVDFTDRLRATLTSSYDYTNQGAFAYGLYDRKTGVVADVNYNDQGSYMRNISHTALRLEYTTPKVMLTSTTGYQYLNDDMKMDQDFTRASIFTINQRQLQHAVNQEITLRSVGSSNYQWSVGAFGFYNDLTTDGDVAFGRDGIRMMLQPMFNSLSEQNPGMPTITITDSRIPNPGTYRTPEVGVALFHQSTFNNLITRGLSLTLGLRVDYERQFLDYNTSMTMNIEPVRMGPGAPLTSISKHLEGGLKQESLQFLPKLSLNYQCTPEVTTYLTIGKGHKPGGYNVQMFSEVIQKAMNPMAKPVDVRSVASYKPEVSWNYEVGSHFTLFNRRVMGDVSFFYMNIKDIQLTQFVQGGSGRVLTNAGRGRSCGAELSLLVNAAQGLNFDVNYGFTHATFTEYDGGIDQSGTQIDYSGNYVPYTPTHTFSVGGAYSFDFGNSWVDALNIAVAYNGAGRIYWTESNDVSQPFYGLLNAKISASHRFVTLEVWAKNVLNQKYGSFYFESFGHSFMQMGRPFTVGASLLFEF